MSIASPPVFLPIPATQVPKTATAAWYTSNDEAVADNLPGLSSNCAMQSPRTGLKSDDKEVSLERFVRRHPHFLCAETEGQCPKSLCQQCVRQTSLAVCCV